MKCRMFKFYQLVLFVVCFQSIGLAMVRRPQTTLSSSIAMNRHDDGRFFREQMGSAGAIASMCCLSPVVCELACGNIIKAAMLGVISVATFIVSKYIYEH